MRTDMDSFGKTRILRPDDFKDFVLGYNDKSQRKGDRWFSYTREQIEKEYNDSLDLGLKRSEDIKDYEDLADPVESGEKVVANLEKAIALIKSVIKELKALENK